MDSSIEAGLAQLDALDSEVAAAATEVKRSNTRNNGNGTREVVTHHPSIRFAKRTPQLLSYH